MTKDEALKLALEALESKYVVNCGAWRVQQDQAITAIREALAQPEQNLNCKSTQARLATVWGYVKAQPEQEPFGYFQLDLRLDAWVQNRDSKRGVAFYTTPPHRKPLTDEEIGRIAGDCLDAWSCARAIEAAHGIEE